MKDLIEALLFVNCRNNFKVKQDEKCRSKECMLNVDKSISREIGQDGCVIYKKAIKVKE